MPWDRPSRGASWLLWGTSTGRRRCWQHRWRPGSGEWTPSGGRLRRHPVGGSGQDTPDRAAERARSWRQSSRPSLPARGGAAPAARARVQPMGADLEDDAPDQLRIDLPARLHLAARGLLDLPEELPRLLVGELDRGRQLGPEDALVLCDEALELARDLLEMRGAALVREQEEEVAQKLVAALEQVPNRLCPGARVELWVAQELPQLRHRGLRFHHLCQLLADGLEPSLILRRVEEGARVDAVDYRHLAPLEHREVELAEGFL